VHADWLDLVPITNATTGVNAVVASLDLRPGDLLLMTNATYPAVSHFPRGGQGVCLGGDVHVENNACCKICVRHAARITQSANASVNHSSRITTPRPPSQVRSTLARAAARSGAALIEVLLPWEGVGDEDVVVSAFRDAISSHKRSGRIRLAVLDHCVSFPPVVMPVQRLCRLLGWVGLGVSIWGVSRWGWLIPRRLLWVGCRGGEAEAPC